MGRKKKEEKRKKRRGRNLFFNMLIAVILYVGIQLLSRTDGTRAFLADKLSGVIGEPVSIGRCEATPLLGLHLEKVVFRGLRMDEVHARLDWLCWVSAKRPLVAELDIRGLEAHLHRNPDTGRWDPPALNGIAAKIGTVLGLNPPLVADSRPRFPAWAINSGTLLQLRQAKTTWYDEKGRELAYILGADLSMKIRPFIDREVRQSLFGAKEIRLASGKTLHQFHLEAFCFGGSPATAAILDMSDADGEYDPFSSTALWQDLGLQLGSLSEM